ncbi:MAG: ORF6N domain-containing protein, partial [Patescibacteria group bacterium]
LRSQFVTSSLRRGGVRWPPFAFTEQGVAMLSSVLRSERAISVNIQIMRTFTRLRELIGQNEELKLKIEALESRYDQQFKVVFDAIRRLLAEDEKPEKEISALGIKNN